MPQISVIVAIYGVEKYIEKCAISLFNQTFDDLEYIFVDDYTPDKSIDILLNVIEKYGVKDKVTILHHDKNYGLPAARNTGLSHATGDYVSFIDSDDWIEKDMYSQLYQYAITNNCDCIYCGYAKEYKTNAEIHYQECNIVNEKFENIKDLLTDRSVMYIWNKLIKRSLFVENNILFPAGHDMWEDMLASIQIAYYAKKIGVVNSPLYHYRVNQNSISLVSSKKQIDAMIGNITSIDLFLRRAGAPKDILALLINGKFYSKNAYLSLTGDINGWRDLFPEINKEIRKQNAGWYIKLYEWSLVRHQDWIYGLYLLYRKMKNIYLSNCLTNKLKDGDL